MISVWSPHTFSLKDWSVCPDTGECGHSQSFFWPPGEGCRILVPWPGIELTPLHWKLWVPTTGPLGKSNTASAFVMVLSLVLSWVLGLTWRDHSVFWSSHDFARIPQISLDFWPLLRRPLLPHWYLWLPNYLIPPINVAFMSTYRQC